MSGSKGIVYFQGKGYIPYEHYWYKNLVLMHYPSEGVVEIYKSVYSWKAQKRIITKRLVYISKEKDPRMYQHLLELYREGKVIY